MKPLVRWTIGNASVAGYDCLVHAITKWKQLYRDRFDMCVCLNGSINTNKIRDLVELVDQSGFAKSLMCVPHGPAWKMYPPRMRIDSHELVIDNDLVIYKELPAIDDFLSGDTFLVTSGYRCFYGQFDSLVVDRTPINTGLIGFPPGYDYQTEINALLKKHHVFEWIDHSDDQGVFMALAQNMNLVIVPMDEVTVCNPVVDFAPHRKGRCGMHFVSLNGGNVNFWNRYVKENSSMDYRPSIGGGIEDLTGVSKDVQKHLSRIRAGSML